MIVKSVGHWSPAAIGHLINYNVRPEAVAKGTNGKPQIFKFNIKGNTLAEFKAAFAANEANRRFARKEHLYAFHEFISLHPADKKFATVEVLEDLAYRYLQLRSPNGMALYFVHTNTNNPHCHIILSPVEIATGNALRITKSDYKLFTKQLQEYQIEKYSMLKESIVDFDKASQQMLTDEERFIKMRTGGLTRKEELKEMLETIFADSYSKEEFYNSIAAQQGIATYERGGEIKGIEDGNRHFRFSTLGYTEQKFQELEERQMRMDELDGDREAKELEAEQIEDDKAEENDATL